jgi:hypothetical protein
LYITRHVRNVPIRVGLSWSFLTEDAMAKKNLNGCSFAPIL